MTFRSIDDFDRSTVHEERRRRAHGGHLADGSLACAACDAPVAPNGPTGPAALLRCPFCEHSAPLREFLELGEPTRPARVVVRVAWRD